MRRERRSPGAWSALLVAIVAAAGPVAHAGILGRGKPAVVTAPTAAVDAIRLAIEEQRLLDAGRMLDQAILGGAKDPRLTVLSGELSLARGRYAVAFETFQGVENDAAVRGDALAGKGLALSLLGRSDDALAVLKSAVELKPSAWRAWNALGKEYDSRQQWPEANTAYEHALTESKRAAIVLNNRGFSRMLQGRLEEAVPDFVEALDKKRDLAAARTNLRLAMAMRGEYDQATSGAPQDNEAAVLNNAGVAAMLRGDYAAAESLFDRAMQSRGEFYDRAAANLQLARSLKSQTQKAAKEPVRP